MTQELCYNSLKNMPWSLNLIKFNFTFFLIFDNLIFPMKDANICKKHYQVIHVTKYM